FCKILRGIQCFNQPLQDLRCSAITKHQSEMEDEIVHVLEMSPYARCFEVLPKEGIR
ncbi:hypothetical protein ScPMuIL_001744, partial [Solemya velum]